MTTLQHKLKRIATLNKKHPSESALATDLIRSGIDPDNDTGILISFGVNDQGDNCFTSVGDWEKQAQEWDCELSDLRLETVPSWINNVYENILHGQMVNVGGGRYRRLRGFSYETK